MTAIKEYKKLYMLETYSKKYYVMEADKIEILDDLIETSKFVKVSGARINVSNISEYYPIPSTEYWDFVISLPHVIRGFAVERIKEWEKEGAGLEVMGFIKKSLRHKFRIPSDKRDDFPSFKHFIVYFLHKNYPNDI